MRLAPVLLLPAALCLACSSPVPATPDAAWVVNVYGGAGCSLGDSTVQFGDSNVTSAGINQRVTDQETVKMSGLTASVACAVIPMGSGFQIQTQTSIGTDSLSFTIPMIDKSATQMTPAMGTVTYVSSATVKTLSGSCNFYFDSGGEGVDTGKFWSAFSCDGLAEGGVSPPVTCQVGSTLKPNYVALESCASSAIF